MTTNETDAQMLACIEAAMREDLSNNIPLQWMDLETGFDSSGRPCGDVIMLLYNNATRLIALARDGLKYRGSTPDGSGDAKEEHGATTNTD